jgi:hypothetical protein
MTTGNTVFPSTGDDDDALSLFTIDIDDDMSTSSFASTTPRNGLPVGTHCPPSPTSEALEPILSPESVEAFWAEIEEQQRAEDARWPMTTPDLSIRVTV